MSQPDLINAGLYEEKPRSNIYTAMLGIAFLSLCVATYLLSLEMGYYDNDFKADKSKAVVVPTSYVAKQVETPEEAAPAEGTPDASATATAEPAAPVATPSATPAATAAPTATATPSATVAPSATVPAPTVPAAPTGTAAPSATATGTAPAPAATAAPSATGT